MGVMIKTEGPVVIFPSSGTGAWEAALVNTLSQGDRVLMYETGHFASLWSRLAGRRRDPANKAIAANAIAARTKSAIGR